MTHHLQKSRDSLLAFEGRLLAAGGKIAGDDNVTHHYAPGLYARELFIPAGTMLTGFIHKTEHLSIMLSGRMLVSDFGRSKMIQGPMVEVARPGIKRVGYCYEDTTWVTVHKTDETDPEVLKDMLVTNDFAEVELAIDQYDYKEFVDEYNITPDVIEMLEKIEVDDRETDGIEIRESERHGLGVFATRYFAEGSHLSWAILAGVECPAGRYANHSLIPNAQMVVVDSDNTELVALRDIDNEEVTVNYRDVINTHRRIQG